MINIFIDIDTLPGRGEPARDLSENDDVIAVRNRVWQEVRGHDYGAA